MHIHWWRDLIINLLVSVSPVAAAAVRVDISPWERTLTAELMAERRWSRSAPMVSAASTHCAATSVAAEATAISVFAMCSSLRLEDEAAVAAAMAAMAAATPATETAACSCALWVLVSSFFFSLRSFSHLPTVLPPGVLAPPTAALPVKPARGVPVKSGCSVLFARRYWELYMFS